MRYKPEHKEQVHRRIVETASRRLRAEGVDSVGIASLMKELGLTHGGFYAHFEDRESLTREALDFALEESLSMVLRELEWKGIAGMLDLYLGTDHRNRPELGCPLPAAAAEIGRHPYATRERLTDRLIDFADAIAAHVPGSSLAARREKSLAILAAMAGAVMLARAVSDPSLSDALLRGTRDLLLPEADEA